VSDPLDGLAASLREAPFEVDCALRAGSRALDVTTADAPLPLASLFKVVLAALALERLALDRRVELTADDHVPGGPLELVEPGASLTVRDCLALMLGASDNSAAQLLHRLLGLGAADHWLAERGIGGFETSWSYRGLFLLWAGFGSRWQGESREERAARLASLPAQERMDELARVEAECRHVTPADVRARAAREPSATADAVFDRAADLRGTAAGLVAVLDGCDRRLLDLMRLGRPRRRLVAGLPPRAWSASRSGTGAAACNDCCVLRAPHGAEGIVVLLLAGVDAGSAARAAELHRLTGRAAWVVAETAGT
jgi:hypothetical protein